MSPGIGKERNSKNRVTYMLSDYLGAFKLICLSTKNITKLADGHPPYPQY
jgi:hypothetical protein